MFFSEAQPAPIASTARRGDGVTVFFVDLVDSLAQQLPDVRGGAAVQRDRDHYCERRPGRCLGQHPGPRLSLDEDRLLERPHGPDVAARLALGERVVPESDVDVQLDLEVSSGAAVLDDSELLVGQRQQHSDDIGLAVVPGDGLMLD